MGKWTELIEKLKNYRDGIEPIPANLAINPFAIDFAFAEFAAGENDAATDLRMVAEEQRHECSIKSLKMRRLAEQEEAFGHMEQAKTLRVQISQLEAMVKILEHEIYLGNKLEAQAYPLLYQAGLKHPQR